MTQNDFINPPPNGSYGKSMLDIPIIHLLYDFYKLWHKVSLNFPKSPRYTLGQICGTDLLLLLKNILAASATKDRKIKLEKLSQASIKLDLIKILIRLAKDCDCLQNKSYLELQSKLHGIGKMLGGWIKSLE